LPALTRIGAAINAAMVLLKKKAGVVLRDEQFVHALAEFGIFFRHELRARAAIFRVPRRAAVIGAKNSDGGNADEHSLRIRRIELDRVQTQSARAGMPSRARWVLAEAGDFAPRFAGIVAAKKRCGSNAGVKRLRRRGESRLGVPD